METGAEQRRTANGHPPGWAGLALGAVLLGACVSERADPLQPSEAADAPAPAHATASSAITPASSPQPRQLEGWLSIVWNEDPHFFLATDEGQTFEILLDEELTAPLGGPLALDRARVSVLAVVTQGSSHIYQALSIELEGSG